MDPIFPEYDYEEEDLRDLYLQAATRLTCSAMEAKLLTASEGEATEETAENVLLFFEMAYRRIRTVAEDDDDYLDEVEENGENEPM